ncbi:Gp49 family protein [Dyella japonica]|uniref:Gp49 family protein n=1 Tax=Dyella japonica TaxID=231455 RepID=UPI00062D33AA|nr:Gp49 family protein [Dyella japonica]
MNQPKKLPVYQSHKLVQAVKIANMERLDVTASLIIYPAEKDIEPFTVDLRYLVRHNPHIGGYFVRYEDGYESFSPANAFERGNTLLSDREQAPPELAVSASMTRVTQEEVDAEIVAEIYLNTDPDAAEQAAYRPGTDAAAARLSASCLTVCVLVLSNGHKAVGINHGPVRPEAQDVAYGRYDARQQAVEQIWPLLGFRLRDRVAASEQRHAPAATDA